MKKLNVVLTTMALCAVLSLGLVSCNKSEASSKTSSTKSSATAIKKLISINSETIYGESITDEYYRDNDLTLVNVMATWCGPCVKEVPELQKINEADNGFGVVGVVIDTFDEITGSVIPSAVDEAKRIAEKTGATYPLVIPTQDFLEQTMKKTAALLPMSFIVDKEGKIVKGPIAGARDMNAWLDILNKVKDAVVTQ